MSAIAIYRQLGAKKRLRPLGSKTPSNRRSQLRRDLKHHSPVAGAPRECGAVQVALLVQDQRAGGHRTLRAGESMQYRVFPRAVGARLQSVHHSARTLLVAATAGYSVQVARAVKDQIVKRVVPCLDILELMHDGFLPAPARFRRQLEDNTAIAFAT